MHFVSQFDVNGGDGAMTVLHSMTGIMTCRFMLDLRSAASGGDGYTVSLKTIVFRHSNNSNPESQENDVDMQENNIAETQEVDVEMQKIEMQMDNLDLHQNEVVPDTVLTHLAYNPRYSCSRFSVRMLVYTPPSD